MIVCLIGISVRLGFEWHEPPLLAHHRRAVVSARLKCRNQIQNVFGKLPFFRFLFRLIYTARGDNGPTWRSGAMVRLAIKISAPYIISDSQLLLHLLLLLYSIPLFDHVLRKAFLFFALRRTSARFISRFGIPLRPPQVVGQLYASQEHSFS